MLAALNRLVAPCSKLGFADWWKTTAADRFTKISASALGQPAGIGETVLIYPSAAAGPKAAA